jgi:hypothetical protein
MDVRGDDAAAPCSVLHSAGSASSCQSATGCGLAVAVVMLARGADKSGCCCFQQAQATSPTPSICSSPSLAAAWAAWASAVAWATQHNAATGPFLARMRGEQAEAAVQLGLHAGDGARRDAWSATATQHEPASCALVELRSWHAWHVHMQTCCMYCMCRP